MIIADTQEIEALRALAGAPVGLTNVEALSTRDTRGRFLSARALSALVGLTLAGYEKRGEIWRTKITARGVAFLATIEGTEQ